MDLCGKISLRFRTNMANLVSVDASASRLSRDKSHDLNFSVSGILDPVAASVDLMSDCRCKDSPRRAFRYRAVIVRLLFVACLDLLLALTVGLPAVQERGSRREVKARSACSIPR